MTNKFKPLFIEISWIMLSILLTLLITGFIFDWSLLENTIDIHLHDTYFVLSLGTFLFPLFFLLNIVIFSIKEARQGFCKTVPNIIILLSGLLLIIYLTNLSKNFIRVGTTFSRGWTAYPPLAALHEAQQEQMKEHLLVTIIVNSITVLQLVVTLALLYISFLWGRNWKHSS
jgi:hypothetical protein